MWCDWKWWCSKKKYDTLLFYYLILTLLDIKSSSTWGEAWKISKSSSLPTKSQPVFCWNFRRFHQRNPSPPKKTKETSNIRNFRMGSPVTEGTETMTIFLNGFRAQCQNPWRTPGLALPTGAVTWAPRSPRWHATIDLKLGVSENNSTPKSSILNRLFPLFSPSILGYLYFWKHPCVEWRDGNNCIVLLGSQDLLHCASDCAFLPEQSWYMIHPWKSRCHLDFYVPIPCWWHNRSVRNQQVCEIPRVEFQVVVWNHETSTGFVPSLSWSMLIIYIDLLVSKIKLE